jgi:hypothetical protein
MDVQSVDIDHVALLANVNQELEQLDAAEAASASAAAGGLAAPGGWGSLGSASSMSLGGSQSGGSRAGILRGAGTPGSAKKKVRWPDELILAGEVDQQPTGFTVARAPRQVSERRARVLPGEGSGRSYMITALNPVTCGRGAGCHDPITHVAVVGCVKMLPGPHTNTMSPA